MVLSDHVIASFSFNNDATDNTGSYDATAQGSPSYTTGKLNECIVLNGTSQYLTLHASLNAARENQSVGGWVYFDDLGDSENVYQDRNFFFRVNVDGTVSVALFADRNGTGTIVSAYSVNVGTLATGTFHCLGVSCDSSDVIQIYFNGTLYTPSTGSDGTSQDYDKGRIGVREGTTSKYDYMDGNVDEFIVCDAKLTQSEWDEFYNAGSGIEYPYTVADSLTLTDPDGGESFTVGDSTFITWTSEGSISNVKIELSSNNGSSYETVISSTPNDGSFSWTVPNVKSTTCLIKISDVDSAAVYDVSDAVFTIVGTPDQVTGGETNWVQSWLAPVQNFFEVGKKILEFPDGLIKSYFPSEEKQICSDFRGTVVKVHDGDTVTLRTNFRNVDFPIRIANINSPELNAGGAFARDWLAERVLNREVDVKIDTKNRVGKYGRLIGDVFVDGLAIGEEEVRQGMSPKFGSIKHRIEDFSKILARAGYSD